MVINGGYINTHCFNGGWNPRGIDSQYVTVWMCISELWTSFSDLHVLLGLSTHLHGKSVVKVIVLAVVVISSDYGSGSGGGISLKKQ